jgi:hypothetical protein
VWSSATFQLRAGSERSEGSALEETNEQVLRRSLAPSP